MKTPSENLESVRIQVRNPLPWHLGCILEMKSRRTSKKYPNLVDIPTFMERWIVDGLHPDVIDDKDSTLQGDSSNEI
jgi:hypothetical protein